MNRKIDRQSVVDGSVGRFVCGKTVGGLVVGQSVGIQSMGWWVGGQWAFSRWRDSLLVGGRWSVVVSCRWLGVL